MKNMKKLLSCLLIAALLFSLTITVGADSSTDGGNADQAPTTETQAPIVLVPNAGELPDGYEIDPDFSITITLDAGNDWSFVLKDLIDSTDSDEYVYFIVEDDVADGYTDYYALNGINYASSSPMVSTGNVIVVRNVKEGEPPVYELPATGGSGTTIYTVAGTAVLTTAAVYWMILHHKRKKCA